MYITCFLEKSKKVERKLGLTLTCVTIDLLVIPVISLMNFKNNNIKLKN